MLRAGIERFMADESGAVTVDWVALAGAMVGLAVLIVLNVTQGTMGATTKLGDNLSKPEISDITFLVEPSKQSSGTGGSGAIAP